jgi:2'-5' RNA ligase
MALPGFGTDVPGERHRLFFALVPDDAIRSEISRAAEYLKSQQHPRGSWIARERYHVTLHFLGDNSELRQDLVDRASAAAANVHFPAFDIVFDSAASFRGPTPPWVLRCPEPAESIRQLWHALSIALVGERLRTEPGSAFTPHITVLRDADKPLPPVSIKPIVWPAREFVLIHSQLGKERRYTELGRWPLSDAAKSS